MMNMHSKSSNPATLEAAEAVDAYGIMDGHVIEIADATQAYIQAKLGRWVKDMHGNWVEVATWVRLPPEYAPESFKKFKDPVVRLDLALYEHTDSGGFWERHLEARQGKC